MAWTHAESKERICIGMEMVALPNLRASMDKVYNIKGDFLIAPLVHPRYERGFPAASSMITEGTADGEAKKPPVITRMDPFTRSDLELNSNQWTSGFIGKLSPWIRCDSENLRLRSMSENALMQELDFATHLSLRAVITPPITSKFYGANFSRALYGALNSKASLSIWVRVPLEDNSKEQAPTDSGTVERSTQPSLDVPDAWEKWNQMRMLCDGHPNLGIALELGAVLPANALDRWNGEPVRAVLVSTKAFVLNRHRYPVLPKRHQELIRQMFKYRCYFAICGRALNTESEGMESYLQYLTHLFAKQPAATEAQQFEAPYYDYIQTPLQPLQDNLQSTIYEVFEKDPVKYKQYQEAVRQYLETKQSQKVVIMVLGAGRGPLVRCCLQAANDTGVEVKIYAVEKNPNAVVTLQNLVKAEKWQNVSVIATDMRFWNPSEKADLVVSELLGSFGDNELSPECLDGAMRCLKDTGVSIPSSYTSYLAPLSSSRLCNELRALGDSTAVMETPYVVKIHRGFLVAPSETCFTFTHPREQEDNSRYKKISFTANETSTVHGLAAYFEATLFGGVTISIRPETHSEGMFSWFPLYFPIRSPMTVSKGQCIEVHMWRRCNPRRVWYEWCISSPHPIAIHNPNGRSYSMSLD